MLKKGKVIAMSKGEVYNKWARESLKQMTVKFRKDDPLLVAVQEAIEKGLAESQSALIKEALQEWVDRHLNH